MANRQGLEFFYADSGDSVVLTADLRKGWHLLPDRVYGFDSVDTLHWIAEWSLRGHLRVYAGRRCGQRGSQAPSGPASGSHQIGSFRLLDHIIEVKMEFRPESLQFDSKGRPRLRVMEQPFIRVDRGLYFSFCAWIVFREPEPTAIPDVREWGQKMFLPGGRPESNRRKF